MKLDQRLLEEKLNLPVLHFHSIDSTNLYCKNRIKNGDPFRGVVIADMQSNGQGRTGKSFYSPEGSGLYFTFCFPQNLFFDSDLTPAVALAVSVSIEQIFSVSCGVKWVNDIYISRRKVGGILCQKVDPYYLIGIGINLEKPAAIPEELENRLGWITDFCDGQSRVELISAIFQNLIRYTNLDKAKLLEEYRSRCVHIGTEVEIDQNGSKLRGTCIGIDSDFRLLVEIDRKTLAFSSGYMVLRI